MKYTIQVQTTTNYEIEADTPKEAMAKYDKWLQESGDVSVIENYGVVIEDEDSEMTEMCETEGGLQIDLDEL